MPRKPIDYTNTIFYKLCCKDINIADVYVGHTTDFRKRKNKHKNNCCNEHNREYSYHVYQFTRANGGWDNWDMVLIERCVCQDALEARGREREHVEQLHASLNRVVPNRSRKEYYNDNADTIRERARERERAKYHASDEMKERKRAYSRQYRQIDQMNKNEV